MREAMKARSNLTLHANIFASSERNAEGDQAMLLLNKYPNTTIIFASATRATLATITAVREKRLLGEVKVVGFGTYLPAEATRAFEDGILYGRVAQQPEGTAGGGCAERGSSHRRTSCASRGAAGLSFGHPG